MTGKERVHAVLEGKKCDKIPWVPFAGVHAGKVKGYTAKEVSTDLMKLTESLLEVNRLYKPDGQPVMFDLQIEAEILGCNLLWSEDAPPTVASHPLADNPVIPVHIPKPHEGRLALELQAMEKMKQSVGESTALFGLLCGPFTLASHLRGTDIFMDMILDPGFVHRLIEYTTRVSLAVAGYYYERGIDIIAAVDPLVSQISPDHFKTFLHLPFYRLFQHIRDMGVFSSFFVCGNATQNIEPMCHTEPDSIFVDENIDLAKVKKITDSHGITLGGNIPLTSIMLFGNQQDNMKFVIDLIDRMESTDGLIIAPGCDMPFDIPPENPIAIEHAIHEIDTTREMIKNYNTKDLVFSGTLPDYEHLEKPLIEVFTLDSSTCAACTYMLATAMDCKNIFKDTIEVVEYKYTSKENIARCKTMGVKQLPSIYINGCLRHSSLIPGRDELAKEIEELL